MSAAVQLPDRFVSVPPCPGTKSSCGFVCVSITSENRTVVTNVPIPTFASSTSVSMPTTGPTIRTASASTYPLASSVNCTASVSPLIVNVPRTSHP